MKTMITLAAAITIIGCLVTGHSADAAGPATDGLAAWFVADQGLVKADGALCQDGDPARRWWAINGPNLQVGHSSLAQNGRFRANALNGHATYRFVPSTTMWGQDEAGNLLPANDPPDYTVFVVVQNWVAGSIWRITGYNDASFHSREGVELNRESGAPDLTFQLRHRDDNYRIVEPDKGWHIEDTNTSELAAAPHIIEAVAATRPTGTPGVYEGWLENSDVLVDGVPAAGTRAYYGAVPRVFHVSGRNLQLGYAADTHGWLDGEIAEVLVYTRALTPTERDETGSYLSEKYAIPSAYSPPCNVTSIDAVKKAADDSCVSIYGAIVTAAFYGDGGRESFAIETSDRSAGIRVVSTAAVAAGDEVSISGVAATVSGERVIQATSVSVISSGKPTPIPVGMSNRASGGGDYGAQPAVIDDAGTGRTSQGLNNVGLLITIYGKVTAVSNTGNYDGYFYVDDGNGLLDGSGNVGVRCRPSGSGITPDALPALESLVTATGVMGVTQTTGQNARYMRTTLAALAPVSAPEIRFGPPALVSEDFESGFSLCWGQYARGGASLSTVAGPGGYGRSARLRSDGSGFARLEALLGTGTNTLTTGSVSFDLFPEYGPGAMELSSEAQWITGVRWLYSGNRIEINTIGGWQTMSPTISTGQWHRLSVEFYGDRHMWGLVFNGQKLGEWDIPVFNPYNMSVGYAGRARWTTAGSCSYYLDNIQVVRQGGTGLGGQVVDAVTGEPVPGASVQVRRGGRTTTGVDGRFDFTQVVLEKNLIPSTINVIARAWAPGYAGATQRLWLDSGTHRADVTFRLPRRTQPEEGLVSGRLRDAITGRPIYGASVSVGGRAASVYGSTYLVLHVPAGEVTVNASKAGYLPASASCTVYSDYTSDCHLSLQPVNPGTQPAAPGVTVSATQLAIDFPNGARAVLLLGSGSELLGFGEVSVNGVNLRKPAASGVPKMNQMGTPRQFGADLEEQFPINYAGCRYVSWEREWDRVVVHSLLYLPNGRTDELDWVIAPRNVNVRGRSYTGIAYGYRFRSQGRKIGQIEDRTTWELGGNAAGCTLLCGSTGGVNQEYNLTYSGAMEVYWPGHAYMHMNPLDYQIRRTEGWELASFPETPALLLVQGRKRPYTDVVEYLTMTLVGAAQSAQTPLRAVLLGTNPGMDQWTNLLDHVQALSRQFYGMGAVPPVALGAWDGAASLNEWAFQAGFARGPGLLDSGMYHPNEIPDPHYNYTPWSYEPAGGAANLQNTANQAHSVGAKIVSWIGLLFAEYAPILDEHPQWIGRTDWDGDFFVYADATHIDIRSGFLTYSLEKLKAAAALGLDGVWLDSYTVVGEMNYGSPVPGPGLDVFCQRQAELQRSGMTVFYGEAMGGTFATGGAYPAIWPNGMLTVPDESQLYLTYLTAPLCDWGIYPMKFDYYKYLAHKAPPIVQQSQLASDPQRPKIIQANKDYRQVFSYMKRREVLSSGQGVLWHADDGQGTRILFAFTDFSFPVNAGAQVYDETAKQSVPVSGTLAAQAYHTYRITGL